jgi:hypothetical protein
MLAARLERRVAELLGKEAAVWMPSGTMAQELDDVSIVPDPPQAAMFHFHLRGDPERLHEAAVELAERTGTWLGAHFVQSAVPGVASTELTIGEANLAVAPQHAAELYSELVGLASTA